MVKVVQHTFTCERECYCPMRRVTRALKLNEFMNTVDTKPEVVSNIRNSNVCLHRPELRGPSRSLPLLKHGGGSIVLWRLEL